MNEENTDKKISSTNRIFYIIFALLLIGSITLTYYRIVILKDYQIIAETSCNPQEESCFVTEPEPCAEGDTECLSTFINEVSYFKTISKSASAIYKCEQTDDKIGCDGELSCLDGELNCSYTFCDATMETCGIIAQTSTTTIE